MVTSKPAQLLQNGHFAETRFGVLTKNFSGKTFCRNKFFGVEKSNVGDHLKRVFPKFEAERSHVRGLNGHSKFRKFFKIRRIRNAPN